MSRQVLLKLTVLLMVVPALAGAQQPPPGPAKPKPPEPVVIPPMVDEKYGSAAQMMTLPPARLIAILKDPEASVYAKAKACQRLAVVGDKTAAPALAALLPTRSCRTTPASPWSRFPIPRSMRPCAPPWERSKESCSWASSTRSGAGKMPRPSTPWQSSCITRTAKWPGRPAPRSRVSGPLYDAPRSALPDNPRQFPCAARGSRTVPRGTQFGRRPDQLSQHLSHAARPSVSSSRFGPPNVCAASRAPLCASSSKG